jgi:hypothetical protein
VIGFKCGNHHSPVSKVLEKQAANDSKIVFTRFVSGVNYPGRVTTITLAGFS